MFRYFVGIELPAGHRRRIAGVMRRLGDPHPVPHITVKDPTGLTPDLHWLGAIRSVAAQSSPLKVVIGAPGRFGARVLYLCVECPGLEALHDRVEQALGRGADHDRAATSDHDYTPHVTVWVARRKDQPPPTEDVLSAVGDLEPFRVDALTVFRRDEARPPYRAWLTVPLGG